MGKSNWKSGEVVPFSVSLGKPADPKINPGFYHFFSIIDHDPSRRPISQSDLCVRALATFKAVGERTTNDVDALATYDRMRIKSDMIPRTRRDCLSILSQAVAVV